MKPDWTEHRQQIATSIREHLKCVFSSAMLTLQANERNPVGHINKTLALQTSQHRVLRLHTHVWNLASAVVRGQIAQNERQGIYMHMELYEWT